MINRASSEKSLRERHDLDAFLRDLGLKAVVRTPEEDPPDFVLEFDGHRIGLEHTRYIRNTTELADAAEWRKFNALLIAERGKGPPALRHILVTVFLSTPLPGKSKRRQLAAEIVEAVRGALPLHPGESRDLYDLSPYPLLRTHVRKLDLIQAGVATIVDWNVDADHASFLWAAAAVRVLEAILRKTARTATVAVEDFWLLVTANASTFSATAPDTMAGELAATETAILESGFSRVYFHDVLTHTVLEWTPASRWRDVSRPKGPRNSPR